MRVTRVAGALGAEVSELNVREALADGSIRAIRELLNEHEVLFFRDQQIEPSEQRDVARLFGPLQTHPAYGTVDNIPEVMLLESTPKNPSKIEVWHSDMTFRQHPPSVTVLKGVTIPEVGGDTLFASMTSAYDGLSEGMKAYLEPLVAVHDFSHGFKESLAEPGGRERLADALSDNPPVRHKVIQIHPETGKRVILSMRYSHLTSKVCLPLSRRKCFHSFTNIACCPSTRVVSTGRLIVWCYGITVVLSTSRLMTFYPQAAPCTEWSARVTGPTS